MIDARRYRWQSLANVLLVTAFGLSVAGCDNNNNTPVTRSIETQILYFNIGGEVQNLDPHTVTGLPEARVMRALLEGLVTKDPHHLQPLPAAAQSWDISPDGISYTFHLRKNARWSNGDKVRAQDFVYAWKRILSPELASEYAYNLYPVQGAEEYHQGQFTDFEQVAVRAEDDHTLKVTLRAPTPYFLHLLDHYSAFPVHPPTLERFGRLKRNTRWTHPENFVGNGAFVLKEWKINQKIVVHKNPLYWDAQRTRLNAIEFYPIDNIGVEERMFRTGRLHITSSLSPEKIQSYRENMPQALFVHPYLATYYYELNVTHPPLDKRKVRRALGLAIDRSQITQLLKGGQQPAFAMTPPDIGGYIPPVGIRFDPQRARELLDEAGYTNRADLPPLELLYNTSESHRQIGVAIQQMWKRHLGIKVTLNNQEWKVYLQTRNNGDFQVARAGWVGDYPDPNNFLDLMMSTSGNNRTQWSNPQYDDWIRRANQTTDAEQRHKLFTTAEALLMHEMPVIPIYRYNNTRLVHPTVHGWHANLMDYHHYSDVYLAPAPDNKHQAQ